MTEPLNRPLPTSSQARSTRPAEDLREADPLAYLDATDGSGMEPDRESPPSTPPWVKAFGIIGIVLVLLFVGLHLTGGAPLHTPSSGGAEHGLRQVP
jgi:hypothetical protein